MLDSIIAPCPFATTLNLLPRKRTMIRGGAAVGVRQPEQDQRPHLEIDQDVAAKIVPKALAWASLNGLLVGDRSVEGSVNPGLGLVHAPISLLPSPFPEDLFHQAVELGSHFNTLVDRVSSDADFLQETLSRTRKADPFTDRLLDIHSKIRSEGIEQNIQLGMHRSDYMRDMVTGELLQVEINTISSSFAGLGSAVTRLHKNLVARIGEDPDRVPQNDAAAEFGDVLGLAWKEFGNKSAVVLFVVQPNERNIYDQFWLESKLEELHGAQAIRRTLTELHFQAHLSSDRTLFVGDQPVAVVYYRSGYAPQDYPSDLEWDVRLLLERSTAIKCPSISYHLTGTKKVQQELAKPSVLERFADDRDSIQKLRKCFAGLWSLENEDSSDIIERAIKQPELFVLKPQREGGGNNLYGEAVKMSLQELMKDAGGSGLAAYILMQRIFPPTCTSYLVRGGQCSTEQTVSELGIFSAYLRNREKQVLNRASGYLLRTKASRVDEGGVATGFSVLDSVYFI